MRYLFLLVISVLILSSCKSTRVGVSQTIPEVNHKNIDVKEYVTRYAPIAITEMKRSGVPASITLAQGIIESDFGRSRLAREANNHFGIKCHTDWRGRKIYHDDDRRNECFRSYSRVEESFVDHSNFLKNGSRYSFLFDLQTDDYKGWAKGLKKAGYATNPKYDNMIINMIEENDLSIYDKNFTNRKVVRDNAQNRSKIAVEEDRNVSVEDGNRLVLSSARSRIMINNRIEYIIINDNDTYESIASDYDLLSWEIFRYNDLDDGMKLSPGQVIYLQPKRMKAEAGKNFHIVAEGETLYSISQQYGIKLRTLYDRNGIEPGNEPNVGDELWLRKTRPEGIR
jgi:LysM repeat protein